METAQSFASLRRFKEKERALSFLSSEEIERLLNELNPKGDAYLVTLICLATGARWSEAEKVEAEQVSDHLITFADTKNTKVRHVAIRRELSALIKRNRSQDQGRLFRSCYGVFRGAVRRAGLQLPDGQLTHILRHTFASHFMMNGGNILALQKILGHQSLIMTMRYAHLSPKHLQESTELNPIAGLTLG
ncbi:MAG: tyrosine-type recombinase/integrase [Candidatus Competibacteraceae bacterium]